VNDKPSFGEILVSQLGKPKEPIGQADVLVGVGLAIAIAAYLFFEANFVRILVRLFRRLTKRKSP
jgi:hypothetical protein